MRIAKGIFIGIVTAGIGLGVVAASAAQREIWSRQHAYPLASTAARVRIDGRGDVIYLWRGGTQSFLVKAAGVSGAVLWEVEVPATITTVELDRDGNAIVTGHTANTQIYVSKHASASGALLWDETFVEDGSTVLRQDVRVDPSGNVVLLGGLIRDNRTNNVLVEYASTNGMVRWQRPIADVSEALTVAIGLATNGDVVIGANVQTNLYVAKFADETGELLWQRQHGHTNTSGAFISMLAVDKTGDVAMTGGAKWTAAQRGKIFTAKFAASTGDALWQQWRQPSAGDTDHGVHLITTEDGDVIVAGVHSPTESPFSEDVLVVRYRGTNGEIAWEKNRQITNGIPYIVPEHPYGLALNSDGNLLLGVSHSQVVAGKTISSTVMLNAADGEEIWETVYTNQSMLSLAAGSNEEFVVSGSEFNAVIRKFRTGPELTIQNLGNEIKVGWDFEYSGWSLQKLITTDGGMDWLEIIGSKETTLLSVSNTSPAIGIFRLVKD